MEATLNEAMARETPVCIAVVTNEDTASTIAI